MIFGIVYCVVWGVFFIPFAIITVSHVINNKYAREISTISAFFFLALTLLIRVITLIPLFLDDTFDNSSDAWEAVIFEATPLMTFLIAAMINSYRWFDIGSRPKRKRAFSKGIRIIGQIVLWFYIILIPIMNAVYCASHDFKLFKNVLAIILVVFYLGMHCVLIISNIYLMIFLVKTYMFLGTIIVCLFARIIAALVYFIIKGNKLGSLSSYELTLILGVTEIIPVILILVSFILFVKNDISEDHTIESNIQTSKDSFSQSLLFGKDESTFNNDNQSIIKE